LAILFVRRRSRSTGDWPDCRNSRRPGEGSRRFSPMFRNCRFWVCRTARVSWTAPWKSAPNWYTGDVGKKERNKTKAHSVKQGADRPRSRERDCPEPAGAAFW